MSSAWEFVDFWDTCGRPWMLGVCGDYLDSRVLGTFCEVWETWGPSVHIRDMWRLPEMSEVHRTAGCPGFVWTSGFCGTLDICGAETVWGQLEGMGTGESGSMGAFLAVWGSFL